MARAIAAKKINEMPKNGSMRESEKTVNAKSKQGIAADIDRTMKTS